MDKQLIKSNNWTKDVLKLYLKSPKEIIQEAIKKKDVTDLKRHNIKSYYNQTTDLTINYQIGKRAIDLIKKLLNSKHKQKILRFIEIKKDTRTFEIRTTLFRKMPFYFPYYLVNEQLVTYLLNKDIKVKEVTKYKINNVKQELINELKQLFLTVNKNTNSSTFNDYIDQWAERLIKERGEDARTR